MGNARGMVDCGYADGRLVDSGILERTIEDSAAMPAIFDTLINEPQSQNTGGGIGLPFIAIGDSDVNDISVEVGVCESVDVLITTFETES